MIFQTNATITKVTTMADQGIRVQIDTSELLPDGIAKLFDLRHKEMWVAFKDVVLEEKDIVSPDIVQPARGQKTPSQRQRAVIFRIWEQNTTHTEEFEGYYIRTMESIIEQLKGKLLY